MSTIRLASLRRRPPGLVLGTTLLLWSGVLGSCGPPAPEGGDSPSAPVQTPRQDVAILPGLDPDRELTQFNLDQWSEREGLPQNFVNSLTQTPDGYLWMGGEQGLVRFDGVRFTVFTPQGHPGLPASWVKSLWTDPDGTLWVGTGGGGLTRYRDGKFTPFGPDEGISGTAVSAIQRDGEGRLWVGTEDDGLFWKSAGGTFNHLSTEDGLAHHMVTAIAPGPADGVWVGGPEGLTLVEGASPRIQRSPADLLEVPVRSLLVGPDGTLWVGTLGRGLYREQEGSLAPFDPDGTLSGTFVFGLHLDRQGVLWVGTNGAGLFRVRGTEVSRLTDQNGLPSNLIWDVMEDREGNLWLGMAGGGLIRLQDGIFETFGAPEGLSMAVALALLEGEDGSVWVGTAGRGVNRIREGEVTSFSLEGGSDDGIILSLAEDVDGSIWVGTVGHGLVRIHDGAVEYFEIGNGVGPSQISLTHVDREGQLWIGRRGRGLAAWRPETGVTRFIGLDEGLPNTYVTTLLEDATGVFWVGTRDGLARIHGDTVETFGTEDGLPHRTIHSLFAGAGGSVWIATMGGLARLDDRGIRALGPEAGLPGSEVMAVTGDDRGYLWLTSNQGVTRVSRDDLEAWISGDGGPVRPQRFGRADGLRSAEANGGVHPAIWRAQDGAIWFASMAGAVRVEPFAMARLSLPPLPVIEEVVLSGESVPPGRGLTLPPSQRTMEFRFSAPLMVAADQVGFRYRLEGFEGDWVTASDRRTAVYTNLPPGSYNFRVQASDREGRWSEAEATLPLELEPLLWERRTAQGAGLLLLLFLGVFGYRYRIRSLEERENRLLQVVREREETEAALRRSEERLRLALEAGDMGTWEWQLEANEVHWSQGLEVLFGESPGSRDQVEVKLAERIPIRDLARLRHAFARVVENLEEEVQLDFPVQRPDGRVRRVELRGRWVGDEASGQRRIMGVAADVTALVEAREALRSREEELRHAQKMEAVGQLAGGVAHDFNNLMAVIGGNTRLALDTLETTHPARVDLEEIRKAGDRAATLTQQLLAFSRKQVLQPRPVYLNDIIRNVERMLRTLLRDDVKLRTELSPERAPVRMDESGVEQILVNVILNAQDAMPKGGTVTISVRNGTRLPSALQEQGGVEAWNGHVILSITDTGQGMDESTRRRVFEPFFTTKEVGKGTGLGLASVYGIVKQSGGTVEVESEEDRGTTFRFRFPQVDSPSPSLHNRHTASKETTAEAPSPPKLPATTEEAGRILLVEDSAPVRQVARRILEASSYEVIEAAGGREALDLFESAPHDIDLLLTDVVMPEMGGPELAEKVRALRPDLPILLMSGHSEDMVATMAGSDAEVHFISKPFTPAELTLRLRSLLVH